MALSITINNVVKPPRSSLEYKKLKTNLKNGTAGYGSALSASYFITQGADQGVSVALGALASYAYVYLLSERVEDFENTAFQKEFLAPISLAAFEVSWNNAPFAFDFDYGCTFIGFLAYKFALSTVLFESVRDMIVEDSVSSYDTSEKIYNDLSDWSEQQGEVDITKDDEIHAITR